MKFLVELNAPSACSWEDVAAYIALNVKAGVGALHPNDPLFDLDKDSVLVRRVRESAGEQKK